MSVEQKNDNSAVCGEVFCRYCGIKRLETDFEIMKFANGKLYRRKRCRSCKNQSRRDRQQTIVAWFNLYKSNLKCRSCGIEDPRVLTFHHSDPAQKRMNVSDMSRRGWSIEQLKTEIEKCEILCANCHLIEHYEDANGV